MNRSREPLFFVCLLAAAVLPQGCTTAGLNRPNQSGAAVPGERKTPTVSVTVSSNSPIRAVTFQTSPTEKFINGPLVENAPPFARVTELSEADLVTQVLNRNPTLAQATAAWQAAAARYPQVTSLDDPMLAGAVGPASLGSNEVDFAYRVEVSQKLPYPGKRALKGQAARAEAVAAFNDVGEASLQLVESAKNAFYEYFLADRALAVNAENHRRLTEARQTAESLARTGKAPLQDVRQADVEIGRQKERELSLRRMRTVAVARINTLMHLPPDSPLPQPPVALTIDRGLPDVQDMRALALARRPDVQALAARVEADEAAVQLALREYRPDFEVMAAYDAFWQPAEKDLRPQLAVRMNLPVRHGRRQAAVAEAQARRAQRGAEFDKLTDQVNFQVQEAHAQVSESIEVVRLYEGTILPAAEANVKEAVAAYATGRVPFLSLVEAQRNLIGLRDRYYEAHVDYFRRRAALERASGGSLLESH